MKSELKWRDEKRRKVMLKLKMKGEAETMTATPMATTSGDGADPAEEEEGRVV